MKVRIVNRPTPVATDGIDLSRLEVGKTYDVVAGGPAEYLIVGGYGILDMRGEERREPSFKPDRSSGNLPRVRF